MDGCCDIENTQLQQSVINNLYSHAINILPFQYNLSYTMTVRKMSFFPNKLTKAVQCPTQFAANIE